MAGITLVVVLLVYGIYKGVHYLASDSEQAVVTPAPATGAGDEALLDQDQDGLPDLVENVYSTNPKLADTDGDGTLDGEEIKNGRNPLQAGPNDALADVPLADDVTNTSTFTGKYLSSLPADLDRSQVLDKTRLSAFVEENKGEILPPLRAGTVKTSAQAGKEAVSAYLDQISSTTNPAIKLVSNSDIDVAFRTASANPSDPALKNVQAILESNYQALAKVAAPQEVVSLHTELLTATQDLAANVKLLANMSTDFVGGLIGAKNIELLGPAFQEIGEDVAALEKKYAL